MRSGPRVEVFLSNRCAKGTSVRWRASRVRTRQT